MMYRCPVFCGCRPICFCYGITVLSNNHCCYTFYLSKIFLYFYSTSFQKSHIYFSCGLITYFLFQNHAVFDVLNWILYLYFLLRSVHKTCRRLHTMFLFLPARSNCFLAEFWRNLAHDIYSEAVGAHIVVPSVSIAGEYLNSFLIRLNY